jgi:hypothetical protein
MLIALLALLGVDLIVIVVFVAFVFTRKRWVKRQPGAFRGAIRVSSGEIDGLGSKWKRGYGRWVRDILIWEKAPFLFRNEFVAVDSLDGERRAEPKEIKRLDEPIVARLTAGAATVEVAAQSDDAELLVGLYGGAPADTTLSVATEGQTTAESEGHPRQPAGK